MEKADEVSRRAGMDRREFLASACGMATTLYAINLVGGCARSRLAATVAGPVGGAAGGAGGGAGGGAAGGAGANGGDGGFAIPPEAMTDAAIAEACLGIAGNELIIDMQTHFTTPDSTPLSSLAFDTFVGRLDETRFPWIVRTPGATGPSKYDRMEYIRQILMGSDTTIAVLSGAPYTLGPDGTGAGGPTVLGNEDLAVGADYIADRFPGRILSQCMVMPNDRLDLQLVMMQDNAERYDHWCTYTAWSPTGNGGYWLDGPEGLAMLRKGIDLGAPVFHIHKRAPSTDLGSAYTNPKDVGRAARAVPDAHLVLYASAYALGGGEVLHSGPLIGSYAEGPYPDDVSDPKLAASYPRHRSVNALISSLRDAGIGPNGNNLPGFEGLPEAHVYADCATAWANLMTRPIEAQHYWGKLLKHVGEDRILWATSCLWFGSPQPLIEAFRAFTISEELQERYGYPALTQARKQKILGQNAAQLQRVRGRDVVGCSFARQT